MDEIGLLRAIYRAVDWRKLYEVVPEMGRKEVDAFFIHLRGLLQTSAHKGAAAAQPSLSAGSHKELELYCDGAASGNPGPAAVGMVLRDPSGQEVQAWGRFIGKTTNNVAEYSALIEGLRAALQLGAERLNIFSDSELMVRQIQGTYRVKNARLRSLHATATKLLGRLESWEITRISRRQNRRADALARAQIEAYKCRKRTTTK